MFRTKKARVIGLVLVGAVVLALGVYTTAALAASGSSATSTNLPTTQTTSQAQLRATVVDMLQDHMGLTAADAEKYADQMIARMQGAGGSWGMMNGTGWADGRGGMMNGTPGSSYGPCNLDGSYPDSSGSQSSGSARDSGGGSSTRGMMSDTGGMMGTNPR